MVMTYGEKVGEINWVGYNSTKDRSFVPRRILSRILSRLGPFQGLVSGLLRPRGDTLFPAGFYRYSTAELSRGKR